MSNSAFTPIEPEPVPRLALTREELAIASSLSVRTIDTLLSAGEIPHVRIKTRVLFPIHEIRCWLTERTQKTPADMPKESEDGNE